jgi:hypothetical protein
MSMMSPDIREVVEISLGLDRGLATPKEWSKPPATNGCVGPHRPT